MKPSSLILGCSYFKMYHSLMYIATEHLYGFTFVCSCLEPTVIAVTTTCLIQVVPGELLAEKPAFLPRPYPQPPYLQEVILPREGR